MRIVPIQVTFLNFYDLNSRGVKSLIPKGFLEKVNCDEKTINPVDTFVEKVLSPFYL
jgi:hypothetical protein